MYHSHPFVPPQPQTTRLQQTPTSNSPASPFSSPPPPHSTSVSPTSQTLPPQLLAQDHLPLALVHHPQQQTDPSHPSLPSSPHPSLQPSLSRTNQQQHNIPRSASRLSNSERLHRSHPHTYYPYPPPHMVDDHPPQHAQAPLPLPSSTRQPMLSLQDLGPYWQQETIAQNYPYPSSLDVPIHHQNQYTDLSIQETNPHLQTTMNHPFPSTHQQQQQQRHSPTTPSPTHANDHTRDQTTMTTQDILHDPMFAQLAAAAAGGQVQAVYTNTAQNLAPNLDASPSWNSATAAQAQTSATTQTNAIQIQHQLEHLYRFQQQQQQQPLAQQLRQDSSRQPLNSHSSIAQLHQQQQQHRATPQLPPTPTSHAPPPQTAASRAHLYSQELRMQQQEQMRLQQERILRQEEQQHQQQQQQQQRERRNSEEEYLRQFHGAFHPHSNNPSPISHNTPTTIIAEVTPYTMEPLPLHPQSDAIQHNRRTDERSHHHNPYPLPRPSSLMLDHHLQRHPQGVQAAVVAAHYLVDGQLQAVQEGTIKFDSPLSLV
ncbi:hypothetical protein QCA50_017371 [Cerrena zonata]|uniref:Uncharacterized protein n=1 Tax=Cerrena zonata TaxID=2478898 RepID=A0AAW0FN16_9APHY